MDANPGLYCHIPFCVKKCPYCNFYSVTNLDLIPRFLKAIKREAVLYGRNNWFFNPEGLKSVKHFKFDTIYIGGGTPSVLNPGQIEDLISSLLSFFPFSKGAEITVEVNPADISGKYLKTLISLGVNRLNLGVQSFNPGSLVFLGRRHTPEEAEDSIWIVKDAGFRNLGIDLIYGLPGQDMESWLADLEKALDFSPEHISCYQLTIEKRTPFGAMLKKGALAKISEDREYKFFMATSKRLTQAGYCHYEISNFAKDKNLISRHNSKYWQHIPYLGLGPSAHSFFKDRRWWNCRSVVKYFKALEDWDLPIEGAEELTKEQKRIESLYFAFRTQNGLDLKRFKEEFGQDMKVDPPGLINMLKKEGKIAIDGDIIISTLEGKAVADAMTLLF